MLRPNAHIADRSLEPREGEELDLGSTALIQRLSSLPAHNKISCRKRVGQGSKTCLPDPRLPGPPHHSRGMKVYFRPPPRPQRLRPDLTPLRH